MSFSLRDLTRELSKLKSFENPSFELEQYATPAHIAADWLFEAANRGEIAGKIILDAACGPGILGLGALLLGAKRVYFIDLDPNIMQICQENYHVLKQEYEIGEAIFHTQDITLFDQEVDLVLQNPPFGTKTEHADKRFLETAFRLSPIIYSMHKYSTTKFVEAITKDHQFTITDKWRYDFAIKSSMKHHTKPVMDIDVCVFRLEQHI